MANEYLRLNDTEMNKVKAENLLASIEQKRKNVETTKEMQSENSVFSDLFAAFKNFFTNLGKPTFKDKPIKLGAPAKSSDYNDRMTELYNDINLAYKETDSLASVVVKDFNYSETDRQMVLNKVRKLASSTVDYSLYTSGAKTRSVMASDDFIDGSKIDFSKITPGINAAELAVNQGVVTLKRTGNIDRAELVTKVTGIKDSLPPWDPTREQGGYEGLYFGMQNEARPEGGSFHVYYSGDGARIFEQGASEDQNMPRRLQMFDNNADTFWEAEYITTPIFGYQNKYSGQQISVAEFNDLVNNQVTSPNVTTSGGTVVTNQQGSLIEDYIPITSAGSSNYFTCSFLVHLSQAQVINWISLNPNNFGQDLYMEVLSIQTSADGQTFSELEDFSDHTSENILTDKVNKELTPQEIKDTISPDRFKYAGQGVWVFAPRLASVIKFNLRQTRSYLKAYEVLMVETQATVTTTTTKSAFFGLSKSTSSSTQVIKQQTELPYLTGLIIGFDAMSLDPGGSSIGTKLSGIEKLFHVVGDTIAKVPIIGTVIGGVVNLVGSILGSIFGTKKTSVSVSPTTISRQWRKTKNDRARFALGVRDINIYSYRFAETSEVVSKGYLSPGPISKIMLQVDETIPKIFYSDSSRTGSENDWIKYYISIDEGSSWHRISPQSHRPTMSEDGVNLVPQVININSDIAGSARDNPLAYIDVGSSPYSVRFKASLSRPTDIQDADSYTPVLSQYSLQIYPLGGL